MIVIGNFYGTFPHSHVSLLQQLILQTARFTHSTLGVEACSNIRVKRPASEMTELQSTMGTEQTSSCPLEVKEVAGARERASLSKSPMNSNPSAIVIMSDSSINSPSSISSSANRFAIHNSSTSTSNISMSTRITPSISAISNPIVVDDSENDGTALDVMARALSISGETSSIKSSKNPMRESFIIDASNVNAPPYFINTGDSSISGNLTKGSTVNSEISTDDAPNKGTKLDTFHRFPTLPIELRLKVWSEAMPNARVVAVEWDPMSGQWLCTQECSRQPCALLYVNKEARAEYEKKWIRFLPFSETDETVVGIVPLLPVLTSRLNPAIDTIYLSSSFWLNVLSKHHFTLLGSHDSLKTLRFLAINTREIINFEDGPARSMHGWGAKVVWAVRIIEVFPSLESIIVAEDLYRWSKKPGSIITFQETSVSLEELGRWEQNLKMETCRTELKIMKRKQPGSCVPQISFMDLYLGNKRISDK